MTTYDDIGLIKMFKDSKLYPIIEMKVLSGNLNPIHKIFLTKDGQSRVGYDKEMRYDIEEINKYFRIEFVCASKLNGR